MLINERTKTPIHKYGANRDGLRYRSGRELSRFCSRLLGRELTHPAQNGTAAAISPGGKALAF
ncbi:MAG: hypothetical protein ACLVMF_07130 [Christensenellales bacterium]